MGPRLLETNQDVDEGQELVNIMREAAAAIDATDSIQIVLEIQEIMKKKESQWSKDLENARSEARNVAQTHQSARVASLRPPNVHSAEQHGVKIASLEEAQFKVSKAINDAEGALTSRQNERLRARGELGSWEAKDVDKDVANSLDTYALRIRLAKQLGLEPVVDKSTGKPTKVIVRNDDYTNMDVVELAGLSEFEVANSLWEKATTMDQATS